MTFNSFQFAAFFSVIWLVCAVLLRPRVWRAVFPRASRFSVIQTRNAILLAASYVFYAAWDWRFLGLLMLSTAVDFVLGGALGRLQDARKRRLCVVTSLVVNLGILGIFKYFDFFAESFDSACRALGLHVQTVTLDVVLPVGISFYTFQSLAYTIDVYRRRLKPEPSPLRFALFVAFFPQLVAGPIERPGDLLPQFKRTRHVTWARVSTGAHLIAVGLFKKVVIADTVARVADAAFGLGHPSGLQVLVGVYAFAFQIYCDFSGYSDIARGAARCLGFELSRNFDMPYFSASPSEFWRRWHITLSSWLRDYLYISLGGNRRGKGRTFQNLMLTMVLGGLWHGAAWTFVIWGTLHGAILCVYRVIERPLRDRVASFSLVIQRLLRFFAVILFFHLVCVSWVFFRAEDFTHAVTLLGALVSEPTRDPSRALSALGPVRLSFGLVSALLGVQILQYFKHNRWIVFGSPAPVRGLVYAVAALLFVWVGEDGGAAFIYFQF